MKNEKYYDELLSKTHTLHQLKIGFEYALPKARGIKPFEIRKDDRNYQVGDFVCYTVIDKQKASAEELALVNSIEDKLFQIVYLTDYPFGIRTGYVVFAEKEV